MLILRVIFNIFDAVSGLHINWGKSFIYPINTVEDLAEKLGGKVGELPTTYLGMPLGAKSKSKNIWSGVIERCEKRLAYWKSQYLSTGGRFTLVSSVMDSIPSYMMSLFPIPASVTDRLDVVRRNFIWKGSEDKKKYHLVKWEELLESKKGGGLNIRRLDRHNKSLMMKRLWKFASPEEALCKEVIRSKYGMQDRWITKEVTTPYNCSVWRSIRKLWQLVSTRTSCKVGNGEKVAFWKDIWCGQWPLNQNFPELYNLCQAQDATVAELWTGQGWNLRLRRNLNDWEVNFIADFQNTVPQNLNLTEEKDSLVWKVDSKGIFTVRSAYKDLTGTNTQEIRWPWRMIWKTKVPYKVNYFTWLLTKDAVLTHENLNKRKHNLCSRCHLCEEQIETVNHLFLHCNGQTNCGKCSYTRGRSGG
uniref:Reverse transcriptase zinc-binding domain-containing protein n=1 Tax=Solanum tuberosum TaxID=4113 RepID=M1A801_SOLTU